MAVYVQNARALITEYMAIKYNAAYAAGAQATASLLALNNGYRRVLSGEYTDETGMDQTHVWSFQKKSAQLTLVTSDADYILPDAWEGDIDGYTYDYNALTVDKTLKEVSPTELLEKRRDDNTGGLPTHYSVEPITFAAATGSTFNWICYPTPTATYNGLTITYRYREAQTDLTDSATAYPAGWTGIGDLIIQAALMHNEQDLGAVDGTETRRFYRMMREMVRRDQKMMPGLATQDRLLYGGR